MTITAEQEQIIRGKICPYCKEPTVFTDSSVIYGTSYGMIYLCSPCQAWVGAHKHTDESKGRLANAELRLLKKEAHKHFDILWKSQHMTRNGAYKWLSRSLGLPPKYTHIGMFGPENCQKVIELSKKKLRTYDISRITNTKANSTSHKIRVSCGSTVLHPKRG